MAKQAFIALLLIIAIWIPPTHATAPNVKAEAATGRKLVENFQDQKVEGLIKLPHKVMVPSGGTCFPPYYNHCDPGCLCIIDITPTVPPRPPMPGNCVCPIAAPTHETTPSVEKEKATPRKLVGEFKDQTVVEKLIKLPRGVMVPNQDACQCPPECLCVADLGPPIHIFCVCPSTPTRETIVSVKAAAATPIEMVGKFQDQTVEKLIKFLI